MKVTNTLSYYVTGYLTVAKTFDDRGAKNFLFSISILSTFFNVKDLKIRLMCYCGATTFSRMTLNTTTL